MKIFLKRLLAVALGLGISLAGVSTASAANLTWTADHTVALTSPAINMTILSGSKANSLIVGTGDMQVAVANGDTFSVTSTDRRLLLTGATTANTVLDCTGSTSSVIITGGAGAETMTITPSSSPCSSSGSTGGSGGSGGSHTVPTPTPTPTPTVGAAHSIGSVVKTSDGTVWFITTMGGGVATRYPFTSAGAFQSYGFLSFGQVVDANASDLALPSGSYVGPRDGSIFCATATKGSDVKGECALITGGMKASFTTSSVFSGQGFSFKNAFYGDSSFLTKTTNIASSTAVHRQGVLVNNKGTVQYVGSTGLDGIPSMDVLTSWGYNLKEVVPANIADKLLTQTGVMTARSAGELEPTGF
jgi:hypothetical protein